MILFVNACVREASRTLRLARAALAEKAKPVTEIRLIDLAFPKVDEAFLEKRDRLIGEGRFDDPLFSLARQFAEAEEIVVAAPYWDLSFPAVLKQYFEQVTVIGITFRYTPEGVPEGLCRAKKLTYFTTPGAGAESVRDRGGQDRKGDRARYRRRGRGRDPSSRHGIEEMNCTSCMNCSASLRVNCACGA